MSMALMVEAMKIKVGNPLRKLVLIKLADNANDKGECWPSYQHIADQCEISRSTVKNHVRDLEKAGLLKRVFRKDGVKNKSNIFLLTLSGAGFALGQETTEVGQEMTEGRATDTLGVGQQMTPEPVTSEPVIEPVIEEKENTKENSPKPKTKFDPRIELKKLNVGEQVINDFIDHRRAKKALITKTALNSFIREAEKAGISLEMALTITIERNWSGFNSSWKWQDDAITVANNSTGKQSQVEAHNRALLEKYRGGNHAR